MVTGLIFSKNDVKVIPSSLFFGSLIKLNPLISENLSRSCLYLKLENSGISLVGAGPIFLE